MKRFVKCIKTPTVEPITVGRYYELHAEVEIESYETGKCLIIKADDNMVRGFDSSFFE